MELLVIAQMDEIIPKMGISKRPSSSLIPGSKPNNAADSGPGKLGYPITFKHIGKGGYDCTLYATTPVQKKKWIEHIEAQQSLLKSRSNFYNKTILCDNFFTVTNKVNCLVPIGKLLLPLEIEHS